MRFSLSLSWLALVCLLSRKVSADAENRKSRILGKKGQKNWKGGKKTKWNGGGKGKSSKGKGKTSWGGSGKGKSGCDGMKRFELTLTNLAYSQPWSPLFVMVHSDEAEPLYTMGKSASTALQALAENGDTSELIDYYNGTEGVLSVSSEASGGRFTMIDVEVNMYYPYVTVATMAVNTNDCFVALNGVKLEYGSMGKVYDRPGLDAGTEENNQLCSSIPGPACADGTGNSEDGNGEGVVHVHRGVHPNDGESLNGDLTSNVYDWRNPMMRAEVTDEKDLCKDY